MKSKLIVPIVIVFAAGVFVLAGLIGDLGIEENETSGDEPLEVTEDYSKEKGVQDTAVPNSKYEDEGAKLEAYSINTLYAFNKYASDSDLDEDYYIAIEYFEMLYSDIDTGKLSIEDQNFYEKYVTSLENKKASLDFRYSGDWDRMDDYLEDAGEAIPILDVVERYGDKVDLESEEVRSIKDVADYSYEIVAAEDSQFFHSKKDINILADVYVESWRDSLEGVQVDFDYDSNDFIFTPIDENLSEEIYTSIIGDSEEGKRVWGEIVDIYVESSEEIRATMGEGYTIRLLNPNNVERSLLVITDGEVIYRADEE